MEIIRFRGVGPGVKVAGCVVVDAAMWRNKTVS